MDWKDEYDILLRTVPVDLTRVSELSVAHFPETLYKYRSFDPGGYWKDWANGTFYASTPNKFNDPFDCRMNFDADDYTKIIGHLLIDNLYQRQFPLTASQFEVIMASENPVLAASQISGIKFTPESASELKQQIWDLQIIQEALRVACFSEDNDISLMWSHYAADHTGFCVGFHFSPGNTVYNLTFPVSYSKVKPIVTYESWRAHTWTFPITLIKSEIWSYEHEWRFVNPYGMEKKPSDIFSYPFSSHAPVSAIYLGMKCDVSSENVKELLNIAKTNGTKVFQMKPSPTKFDVYPELIYDPTQS